MAKTIIKETFIMLLLLVCIVLVFGVVFYEDIPLGKVVPNKVAYEVPEEVKNDLTIDVEKEKIQTQTITYSIDGRDLSEYEQTGRLEEGRPNPFASYTESSDNTTTGGGSSAGNTTTNNNNTYYPNTGLK